MKSPIEIIIDHGFTVEDFTGTQTDFDGVDCFVYDKDGNKKHVDYKADTTLGTQFYDCGLTGLISLFHKKPGRNPYVLPKYLTRTDVYVWLIDVVNERIFEISPSMLSNLNSYIVDYKWKSSSTDELGKEHLLGVIKLSDCRFVTDKLFAPGEIYETKRK